MTIINLLLQSQTSSYTTMPSFSSQSISRPRTRPSPQSTPIGLQSHSPALPRRPQEDDDYVEVPTVPNSPQETYHNVFDYTGIGSGGGRGHAMNGGLPVVPAESREGSIKGRRGASDRYGEDQPELHHQRSTGSMGSTSTYSRFDRSTYVDPAYFVDPAPR